MLQIMDSGWCCNWQISTVALESCRRWLEGNAQECVIVFCQTGSRMYDVIDCGISTKLRCCCKFYPPLERSKFLCVSGALSGYPGGGDRKEGRMRVLERGHIQDHSFVGSTAVDTHTHLRPRKLRRKRSFVYIYIYIYIPLLLLSL